MYFLSVYICMCGTTACLEQQKWFDFAVLNTGSGPSVTHYHIKLIPSAFS